MQVLFSKVPKDNEQGDETLVDAEGNFYHYTISDSQFSEEEFAVADSAGRSVPFRYEDLDALIEALENFRVNLVDTVVENLFNEPDSVAILD